MYSLPKVDAVLSTGSWIRPHVASPWVQALARWGNNFPTADASEMDWSEFESSSLKLPTIFFSLSACFALAVPLVLCCCHPHFRGSKAPPRPPWETFGAAACTTLAFFAAACCACDLAAGSTGLAAASQELRSASADAWGARRYAQAMNVSGAAILHDFDDLLGSCPGDVQRYLKNSFNDLKRDVVLHNAAASRLVMSLVGLPEMLADAEAWLSSVGHYYVWFVAYPSLALIACCCAVTSASLAVAEYAGPRVAKRCERFQPPCVSVSLVAPGMLLVALAIGAELSLGIKLSALCMHVDARTLNYVEATLGNESVGANMTRYYIAGPSHGQNQALRDLQEAENQIRSSVAWMVKYREAVERTCPRWQSSVATSNLQSSLFSLNESWTFLAPSRAYGHYHTAVYELGCGSIMSGLGWLVVFQALLLLGCMPLFVCSASCLLQGLMVEREVGHRFDALPLDEESAHQSVLGVHQPGVEAGRH